MINIVISYTFKESSLDIVSKYINKYIDELKIYEDNSLKCDIYRIKKGVRYIFVIRSDCSKPISVSFQMQLLKMLMIAIEPYLKTKPMHIDTYYGTSSGLFV